MKVAIVCGHFVPALGYVEVHLANALNRLGHKVKVITSNKTSFSASHLKLDSDNVSYDVARLKSWFSYGQIVVSKGITKEIENFNPDKVIVIGLGKVFPKEVFKIKNKKFELITLLGDNEDTYNNSSKGLKRSILQSLFKTPVYELAIKNSDRLVGYTPSTKEIVETFISEKLKSILSQKYSESSLGFDENEFYRSTSEQNRIKKDLGIKQDELVIITATRITPAKKIEKVIDAIESLTKKGLVFKYVLIGFSESEYCSQLKKYISSKQLNGVVIALPFIARQEMNNYYNIANLGLWTQAAISIFEGLATGLFLLLPDKKNVAHILTDKMGYYYRENELSINLENSIRDYNSNIKNEIAESANIRFSFSVIAQKILNS